jgi:hypothetical protein
LSYQGIKFGSAVDNHLLGVSQGYMGVVGIIVVQLKQHTVYLNIGKIGKFHLVKKVLVKIGAGGIARGVNNNTHPPHWGNRPLPARLETV